MTIQPRRGFVAGFAQGAGAAFRALRLLRAEPALWRYVLVPVLLSIVLFVVLTLALLIPGLAWIDRLAANLPPWLAFLEWLLRLLVVLLLLALNGLLLAQFGVALGAPWYSALSARIELNYGGLAAAEVPLSLLGVLGDVARALFFQLGRLLIMIVAFVVLLPLNLVPAVGSIAATLLNALIAAWLLSLDFFDPPLDRRRLSFRQKLSYLRRHAGPSLGLGLVFLALVSIPLLNLLTVPLGVVAGTMLFCDLEHAPK